MIQLAWFCTLGTLSHLFIIEHFSYFSCFVLAVCTYNYPSLMTFDSKHVVLPRTSCEIKLVGSCQGHSLEFAVTVQPATDATVPKVCLLIL